MTISSTANRVSYTGDGTTDSFPFSYYVIAAADLKVYQNGTLKTLTTHYTLSGSAPYTSGTDVEFVTAPAADDEIVIVRDPAIKQLVDLVENDPLPVESGVEAPLDKLTMIAQRLSDRIDRSFHLADSDVSGASTEVPTPEANTFLAWDSDALALVNITASDLATVAASQNMIVELFTDGVDYTAGTTTSLTLSQIPGAEENLTVTFDGATQHHNTFSTSGLNVTFSSAIPVGVAEVEIKYLQTLDVGTIASENASWVQAGTGAVETNVRDVLREIVVSVKQYGAVGDGATDDTAAFAAFVTYLASSGKKGFVPAGSYKTTTPITLQDACQIEFDAVAYLHYYGAAGTACLQAGASGQRTTNIRLVKPGIVLHTADSFGMYLLNVNQSKFYDVYIEGVDGSVTPNTNIGIYFDTSTGIDSAWNHFVGHTHLNHLHTGIFSPVAAAPHDGFVAQQIFDYLQYYGDYDGVSGDSASRAVDSGAMGNSVFKAGYIEHCGKGFVLSGLMANAIHIDQIAFDHCYELVNLSTDSTGDVRNFLSTNSMVNAGFETAWSDTTTTATSNNILDFASPQKTHESVVSGGGGTLAATTQYQDTNTVVLSAIGDYDIYGVWEFAALTGATATQVIAGLSIGTAGNAFSDAARGSNQVICDVTGLNNVPISIPAWRVSVTNANTPLTVRQKSRATYGGSAPTIFARLTAIKVPGASYVG